MKLSVITTAELFLEIDQDNGNCKPVGCKVGMEMKPPPMNEIRPEDVSELKTLSFVQALHGLGSYAHQKGFSTYDDYIEDVIKKLRYAKEDMRVRYVSDVHPDDKGFSGSPFDGASQN